MNKHCVELEHASASVGGYEYCTVPHCGFFALVYRKEGAPIDPRERAEAVDDANWLAFNTPRAN